MGQDFEYRLRTEGHWTENEGRSDLLRELRESVPEEERVDVRVLRVLLFSSILEVDPLGDIFYEGPHLYCRYDGPTGPFRKNGGAFVVRGSRNTYGQWENVHPENHKPLFASLGRKLSKGKTPITFVRDSKKWYDEHL